MFLQMRVKKKWKKDDQELNPLTLSSENTGLKLISIKESRDSPLQPCQQVCHSVPQLKGLLWELLLIFSRTKKESLYCG